jgi:hypothetical protein
LLKTRKRWVALLTAVVMIAALIVPFAGTASAACTYSLSYVPAVSAGANLTSAQIPNLFLNVTLDATSITHMYGSEVVLELPSSPTGYGMTLPDVTTLTGTAGSTIPVTVSAGAAGTEGAVSYTIYASGNGTLAASNPTTDTFSIPVSQLFIPGGVNGNVTLTAAAPNGSLFASGSLTLATAGSGAVTLAAESVQSIGSSGDPIGTIDITESMQGALINGGVAPTYTGSDALKLTLPPGFTWDSVGTPTLVWGSSVGFSSLNASTPPASDVNFSTSNGGRELDINVETASTQAWFIKLVSPTVSIDESTAKQGNVVVTVAGNASYSPSTLTVANYGTYAVSTKVLNAPTITAGVEGSTIGEFEITEGLPGSLINNRTIDLTLPGNLAWTEVPQIDMTNSTIPSGLNIYWTAVGSTGNEIEGQVEGYPSTAPSSAAVIALKSAEITPAVDFTGAVNVTVGGTEGLTGTLNLGTVVAPISATASATPAVTIGTASAAIGDLTITEAAAADIGSLAYYAGLDTDSTGTAILGGYSASSGAEAYGSTLASPNEYFVAATGSEGTADIDVWAPSGVTFFNTPTVTVTAGDLQLGTVSTNTINNQGELVIPINSTSTTASTIKITGAEVTIDRTVPEGPITFKIEGPAVDETELDASITNVPVSALFPNDTTAASVNVATVSTAAEGSGAGTSVFTIGATSYTMNGTSVSMDVAPYIKDSRTFLPLRYVANALGVADSNIMYDAASQKVTIIKGSMVVQLTIGSTTMLLNGAAITMDTAPEITSGRTCLPVAWVGQALNASVVWNATAQTVTVTSN